MCVKQIHILNCNMMQVFKRDTLACETELKRVNKRGSEDTETRSEAHAPDSRPVEASLGVVLPAAVCV